MRAVTCLDTVGMLRLPDVLRIALPGLMFCIPTGTFVATLAAGADRRVVAWTPTEWWTVALSLFEVPVLALAFRNWAGRLSESAGDATEPGAKLRRPA